jgi:hypothetical protein
VAGDQVAVLGDHEIGLHVVGAELDSERVRLSVCSGR